MTGLMYVSRAGAIYILSVMSGSQIVGNNYFADNSLTKSGMLVNDDTGKFISIKVQLIKSYRCSDTVCAASQHYLRSLLFCFDDEKCNSLFEIC
jgi:hypothetical protein